MNRYFITAALLIVAAFGNTSAQYYYKDILSVKQANAEKQALQVQKIRKVIVHSFEANGTPSEGFFCEKEISSDFRRIETYTKSHLTNKSLLSSYYNDKGLIVKLTDSSETTAATTLYSYNDKNDIKDITSYTHSSDEDFNTSLKEVHQYIYDQNGKPVRMVKIKNDRDTTVITFMLDEKGNVSDEIEPGLHGRHYYYYYTDKNQLSDIVKFNVVKRGLRPDVIFEYDADGQLEQMISVEEGVSDDYYTWKYVYNNGLKIIEKCFAKNKTLLGYVEYEYD
jgi:hypothetical protein